MFLVHLYRRHGSYFQFFEPTNYFLFETVVPVPLPVPGVVPVVVAPAPEEAD